VNKFYWKKTWYLWIVLIAVVVIGYYFHKSPQPETDQKVVITKLINELKGMITEKGGYNLLVVNFIDSNGSQEIQCVTTFTKDIKSNNWEGYIYNGKWMKNSNTEFEPGIMTLSDFDIIKLLPMIEQSKNKVITEKNIKEVTLKSCLILISNGPLNNNKILIKICPKYGGTDFKFTYDIHGNLYEFTYDKPIVVGVKPN
jgi:hypothetical protein